MELGYVLLVFDVLLGISLVAVYRSARRCEAPRDVSRAERQALEDARRAALYAADDATRARAELEAVIARAERFTRQWADAALDPSRVAAAPTEPAAPTDDPARERVAAALAALRRA